MGLARITAVVMLGLLITACAPAGDYVPADPAALRSTAKAAEALAGQVEESLAATRAAQESLLRQTAEALAVQSTAQALTYARQATALALEQEAFRATATVRAVEEQAAQEAREREREAWVSGGLRLLGLVTLSGLAVVLLLLVWKAGNEWITWQARRRQLVESRAGTLLLLAENAPPVRVQVITPSLPSPPAREENWESEAEPIPYTVNGELVGFFQRRGSNEDPQRRLALRLLRESIQAVGGRSNRLPGWRELGWSAEQWSQAVRLLWRYVETQPGKGTYLVGEYPTLQELYFAVGEKRAILSPAPQEIE